jgi:copper chaperone NosL
MKKGNLLCWILVIMSPVLFARLSLAEGPVKPQAKDKCPVCGMFISLYPMWMAEIVFRDGTYAVFDGPKDMLKYYFDMSRYNKAKTSKDISRIYVTEYYTTDMMEAKDIFFIRGSDVMGPMGKEFVPVKGKREALTFMRDHHGKKMFRFNEITASDIP